jgi:23S rRNA pseudouridine955/2504/2580 synthase
MRNRLAPLTAKTIRNRDDGDVLSQMLLHEDSKVLVFNKPAGLAVQGGSGVTRNVDDMLEAWRNKKGEKPRLVHRLDRDTAGRSGGCAHPRCCPGADGRLPRTHHQRRPTGRWSPACRATEGKISTWLVKEATEDGDRMRVAKHGEPGADHAVSYYRIIEKAAQNLCLAGARALHRPHASVAYSLPAPGSSDPG